LLVFCPIILLKNEATSHDCRFLCERREEGQKCNERANISQKGDEEGRGGKG